MRTCHNIQILVYFPLNKLDGKINACKDPLKMPEREGGLCKYEFSCSVILAYAQSAYTQAESNKYYKKSSKYLSRPPHLTRCSCPYNISRGYIKRTVITDR
jgi:hypothetical protein